MEVGIKAVCRRNVFPGHSGFYYKDNECIEGVSRRSAKGQVQCQGFLRLYSFKGLAVQPVPRLPKPSLRGLTQFACTRFRPFSAGSSKYGSTAASLR